MSPRVLKTRHCPHCQALLPEPTPRVCPECAGSLQKRFLSIGCLSSAPPVVLLALGLRALVVHAGEAALREPENGALEALQRAGAPDVTTADRGNACAPLQCLASIHR